MERWARRSVRTLVLAVLCALGSACTEQPPPEPVDPHAPIIALPTAAAAALLEDYDVRNNAAIAAAAAPRYDPGSWHLADTGPTLLTDLFSTRRARVLKEAAKGTPLISRLVRSFSPALSDYPHWACVAHQRTRVAKSVEAKGATTLGCFVRSGQETPWLLETSVSVPISALPRANAAGRASTSSEGDTVRVQRTLGQLETYWETGRRPTGLTLDGAAREIRRELTRAARRDWISSATMKVSELIPDRENTPGMPPGPRTLRVQGGLLAVQSWRLDTYLETVPEAKLMWKPGWKRIYGDRKETHSTYALAVTTVVFVPRSGTPRILGVSEGMILP